MKHLFTTIFCLISLPNLMAKGIEVQLSTGLGFTNTFINPIAPKSKPIASYNGGVCMVAHFDDLIVTAGVLYYTTGYSISGEFIIDNQPTRPPVIITGTKHSRFIHLGIPVLIGNRFNVAKRVHLASSIGLMPAYNISSRSIFHNEYFGTDDMLTDDKFSTFYNRFSLFGTVQSRLEVTCSKTVNLFFGSAFRAMLTDIRKPTYLSQRKEKEYTITLETGMGVRLSGR